MLKENVIVFATSKLKVAKYKVEHYQENIYDGVKTWSNVKAKVAEQISLKDGWKADEYEIYDYRWENYEGEEIKDDTLLKGVMRVYPRSNYAKFK